MIAEKDKLTPDNPYVKVWNCALKGLLGWTPEQVHERIVKTWQEYMEECGSDGMFYHEGPDYYLWPILFYEWRNEAPESIRNHYAAWVDDKDVHHDAGFFIDLAASQEEEIMRPLIAAYRKLDWLHVHDDEEPAEPDWASVAGQVKKNIREMLPFEEWKKARGL